jgi:hypothetical protein
MKHDSVYIVGVGGFLAENSRFSLAPPTGIGHDPPPMSTAHKLATQTPARSLDQRKEALQRANEIRIARAQLKRDLKAGTASIGGILTDPPEWVLTAKVFDLLLAVPKCGRVKAGRILTVCRISSSKTVGGLSERQRAELVALLRR